MSWVDGEIDVLEAVVSPVVELLAWNKQIKKATQLDSITTNY